MERELKAAYSVTELAELMGLNRDQLERMLHDAGVPMRPVSKAPHSKRLVWLSDLRNHMGHAWDSVRERIAMQALEKEEGSSLE